jgi:DNA-directed RNA polymerase specialized sigma24 family protein
MQRELTTTAFTLLLDRLSEQGVAAGERYEDLRRTLTRFFEWRGAPVPEERTDETLDRIARKLSEGVEIKHVGGYAHEVARLVYLESVKREKQNPHDQLDEIERTTAAPPDTTDEQTEKEVRLNCLDQCLGALPAENRELITEYYRDDKRGRIDHRKALADRLGLRRDALANRVQRLRDKLEQCVTRCARKKLAI